MKQHIVCVLRSGGDFAPAHVQALYDNMCGQGMKGKFTFHVLTDGTGHKYSVQAGRPINIIPLANDWSRWWPKIELFRSDVSFNRGTGRVLYLDLDTVVLEPLDEMFALPNPMIMLHGFRRDRLASGIMMWDSDKAPTYVYTAFFRRADHWMRQFSRGGDQAFIAHALKTEPALWQKVLPGWVVSYKRHIRHEGGVIPPRARVVCFHGKPRPWDCGQDWAMMWMPSDD